MKSFPFYKQPNQMDCGPTCLRMITKFYGRDISLLKLRNLIGTNKQGSSMKGIADVAEKIGFRTLGVKISFELLAKEAPLPCIIYWEKKHFIVVYRIKKNKIYIADPAQGLIFLDKKEFIRRWINKNADENTDEGIVLLLEATPKLEEKEEGDTYSSKKSLSILFPYILTYKKYLVQLCIGLFTGSLLQLIFPFLTQSIVDIGINNKDIDFVYLILSAQIFLFFGKTSLEALRGWILLHISSRVNISLIANFFAKLMGLPIAYFDTKMTGDIIQKIYDHQRIESFLTTSTLQTLFSFFNLIIFGGVLAWYNLRIFIVFFIGSVCYLSWVFLFLNRRKVLDNKKFSRSSEVNSKIIELVNGMQEIKLHNSEKQKRWSWEVLQAKLYRLSIKSLSLEQTQTIGSSFINEIKNIVITILSAKLVIDGQITLGMMLSISYISGQLNGPVQQLITFIHSFQDAKISIERLSEVHQMNGEDVSLENTINEIPGNGTLTLQNISFSYLGSTSRVIENLSFEIPSNKITAIVGASGSGKTTLMKILLKFYNTSNGDLKIDNYSLSDISHNAWREHCGVVMQEGYIFNDTIANNIAVGVDSIDIEKLLKATQIANIQEFIEYLPLKYNTKVGMDGIGLSTGQKQRILIARAVYKDPKIIFFDEATSALDTHNERVIMQNLQQFFKERTVVIIAHRLSTVKNANQIVVLGNGSVLEKGTHETLLSLKGNYFNLVKDQLELEKLDR